MFRRNRTAYQVAATLAAALVVSVGVRIHVAQVYRIESSSMAPTLHEGDHVLVERVSRHLRDPARGDIVVLVLPPADGAAPVAIVKRVAGVPGDVIAVTDGRLYRNGSPVDEPWALLAPDTPFGATVVRDGAVFVLGDNRAFSLDSRNGLGLVPITRIVGRALWRIHPDPGVLSGPSRAAETVPQTDPAGTLRP
jgi:signal peptidase I